MGGKEGGACWGGEIEGGKESEERQDEEGRAEKGPDRPEDNADFPYCRLAFAFCQAKAQTCLEMTVARFISVLKACLLHS